MAAWFLCIAALGTGSIVLHHLALRVPRVAGSAVALVHCCLDGQGFDMMRAPFFLSRKMVDNKPGRRFNGIERRLFIWMHRHVTNATEFFRIPRNRIVELGGRIEL